MRSTSTPTGRRGPRNIAHTSSFCLRDAARLRCSISDEGDGRCPVFGCTMRIRTRPVSSQPCDTASRDAHPPLLPFFLFLESCPELPPLVSLPSPPSPSNPTPKQAPYTSSTTPPVDPASLLGRSLTLSAAPERNLGIEARGVRHVPVDTGRGLIGERRRRSRPPQAFLWAPQTVPRPPAFVLLILLHPPNANPYPARPSANLFIWLVANCVLSTFGIGIPGPGIFFLGLGDTMLVVSFMNTGRVYCRLIYVRAFLSSS
ncbi:hypothetical protein B0H17DRAFT_1212415 [Mycena rosella]|uniref:Uncharacterized protein n=1 Tax=Mycena rosella TaxID=1033263 RepID=A0AAD7G2Z0_MYCRO|nr:hypothetical protein B0H17DRAFT_1212415 [Mycena rosella]